MAGEFSYLSTDANDMSAASFAYYSCGAAGLAYKTCKAKNLDLASQDSEPLLRYMDSLIGDHYPDPDSKPLPIKADGKQIFRWLEEGDPVAERIYTEFISSLRQVIHNIQITVGPDLIALGGGLSLTPGSSPTSNKAWIATTKKQSWTRSSKPASCVATTSQRATSWVRWRTS